MFEIYELRCEYAERNIAVQTPEPRFSWKVKHPTQNRRQEAYQIIVASSLDKLSSGKADRWDSGRIESRQMTNVVYNGAALHSGERCWWTIRVWDSERTMVEAAPSWFEMGLLTSADWKGAEWIGAVGNWTGRAILFRHTFELDKSVCRGRVYLAGLGWHELRVNQVKIGDRVLEPPPTDYA